MKRSYDSSHHRMVDSLSLSYSPSGMVQSCRELMNQPELNDVHFPRPITFKRARIFMTF